MSGQPLPEGQREGIVGNECIARPGEFLAQPDQRIDLSRLEIFRHPLAVANVGQG
jgi:hypothetical protein